MSTDKEKTETGGDSPVLFGPSNDPRLSDDIDALTGDALDGVIAKLEAFSDNVFGEDEDEDPFPSGISDETSSVPEGPLASGPEPDGSEGEGEEGIDRILDRLSEEPETAPEDRTALGETGGVRSLREIARTQEAETPVPTPQRSPIADVLAGSEVRGEGPDEAEYFDPGFADQPDEQGGEGDYDPLGDVDLFDGPDDEASEILTEDPDFPDDDPDFPDDELPDLYDEAGGHEDDAQSDHSYALPEPSPYGDQGMMGGPYGDDEDEFESLRDEAEEETPQDMLEDWPMPENRDAEQAAEPIREPAAPDSWADQDDAGETRSEGSDLDDLITGLAGGAEPAPTRPDDEAEASADHPRDSQVPAFLRRDEAGRPLIGVRSGAPTQEDPVPDESPEPKGEDVPMSDPEHVQGEEDVVTEETTAAQPERSGRKRMLAGVAALALLAAAGFGAYTMIPGMLGQPDMAQLPSGRETDPDPAEVQTPFEAAELLAPADPMEVTAPEEEFVPVPADVSELLAELSREPEAPAPAGVSPEEMKALEARLGEVEQARTEAEERASGLTEELTSLTDQITGLLQRDGEQAERLERMERLIRGQSAIMAQFGQMEESLEQTQVVLLDVSARIGAVEGQNPADRDAVNRALSDVEERIQALTANMSILARMSIEGVDALRAPNASSGTVGVRTSPDAPAPSGGADTVFQSETGGFRITSDPAGRIGPDVAKDDFVEGYGYVLDVLPASDGQRLVIMENGSVLIPSGE
jgi:hypothetical protein